MKVVLVNHSDSRGGASVVSMRLLEALRREGVVASMVVAHKSGSAPEVILTEGVRKHFLREHAEIFLRNGLSRKDLFKASIATSGLELHKIPEVAEADIVVLNWINQGMMSLKEIALLAAMGKKIVWTMHDMWNMTGICHHAYGCENYLTHCRRGPLLGSAAGERDASARTFDAKKALYDSVPIHFVAVSNWLADVARRSVLLRGRDITVINNPFSVEELGFKSAFNRGELGLPWNGRIILFCAARIDDPMKNLPAAIEALNTLTDTDAVAVFVGACKDPRALDGLKLRHYWLGPVYDRKRLRNIFGYASVVMSSSDYESFGATLLEGQAMGVTPVAPAHDGRADIITDRVTGYAAGPGIRTLGEALRLALRHPLPQTDLRAAAERYSYPAIAQKYIELFNSITGS